MPKIESDGLQIHYDDQGEGPSLVLLHGFLFDSRMWTPQIEELRDDFRIVTVDFRGHGQSSPVTAPFTLYDLVSDVVSVLGACNIERAVWIGLSMGGMVALRAAIVSPEAVHGLVLLDTDGGVENAMAAFRYKAMVTGAGYVGLRPFLPTVGKLLFGVTTREENRDLVTLWKQRFLDLDIPSIRQTLEAISKRDDLGPMLHEIDVPTLVIVGDEDRALPPSRSQRLAEGIVGSRLEIVPLAGHLSNLERPRVINGLLRGFLGSFAKPAVTEDFSKADPEDVSMIVADETDAGDGEIAAKTIEQPLDELTDSPGEAEEPVVDDRLNTEIPEAAVTSSPASEPLEDYVPSRAERKTAEFMLPGGKKGRERRGKRRVSPSRKLYGRVGHIGILVVDISESGAKIEHYNRRFATGSTITIELEWEGRTLRVECDVVSCRVHRFIPGDKGATVYQSGLLFRRMSSDSSVALRELISRLVTRGLAEQVANARGIGPVLQNDMPTFRSGTVSAGGRPKEAGSEGPSRLIRSSEAVEQTGYIRCRKIGPRWERKWTVDPRQPPDGFTLLASENKLDIDTLCETWDAGDAETRKFLRECARASIGVEAADPEE